MIAKLTALRKKNPLLRQARWFADDGDTGDTPQLHWYTSAGVRMGIADWHDHADSVFACQVQAGSNQAPSSCVVFNPQNAERAVQLANGPWRVVLDTSAPGLSSTTDWIHHLSIPAHSVILLTRNETSQEPSP